MAVIGRVLASIALVVLGAGLITHGSDQLTSTGLLGTGLCLFGVVGLIEAALGDT